jgi:hypothetical protein
MLGIALDIWNEATRAKLIVQAQHVPRENNKLADALSRYESPLNESKMAPGAMQWAVDVLRGPQPTQDVFARRTNSVLPRYLSWLGSERGGNGDALVTPWDAVTWTFPPPPLCLQALRRFSEQHQARVTYLVVPVWSTQPMITAIESATGVQWRSIDLPLGAVQLPATSSRTSRRDEWRCYAISKTS